MVEMDVLGLLKDAGVLLKLNIPVVVTIVVIDTQLVS